MILKNGWFWFAILLIGAVIFWPRQTAAIIPGVVTVRDTVVTYDTIRLVEYRNKIVAAPVARIVDTIPGVPAIIDTPVCYTISEDYSRGAHVSASLCSRSFTQEKPIDLSGVITYLPPVDSIRVESRVDTIPKIIYKKPILPTWQTAILGVAVGVVGGVWLSKKL